MDPLLPTDPMSVGRYRLLGRLGAGGMGEVFLAEAPDGSRCAVKMLVGSLRMAPELRERLAREARSLMAIDSPHVVRVLDVDTNADIPYLVMAYVEGVDLDEAVPAGGLDVAQVKLYGAQLAEALAAVHARGTVHRDLKPRNVILGPDGVTLVDFGIASLDDEGTTALTREGSFLGSLAWLAPELIEGASADERSDVFGLGLVLGYMAVGRHPFGEGRAEAVMYRIIHGQADLRGCDPFLAAVIEAALAREPETRPTADQLRDALITGRSLIPVTPPRAKTRRRRTPIALAGLGAATIAAAITISTITGSAGLPTSEADPIAGVQASTSQAAPSPTPAAPGTSQPTESDPAEAPPPSAETVTVTAQPEIPELAREADGAMAPKPDSWPDFEHNGPAEYNVCFAPDYPLPGELLRGGDGSPGGYDPNSLTIAGAQAGLRSLNYGKPGPIEVTGFLDAETEDALKSFQTRKGIVADGTLGEQTWTELHSWVNHYQNNCP